MIYATNIYYQSYLSFFSAFQYYGITTQLPFRIMVATFKNRSLNDIEFIKMVLLTF
jgi:predicted transcriptional regulator of viral defense system